MREFGPRALARLCAMGKGGKTSDIRQVHQPLLPAPRARAAAGYPCAADGGLYPVACAAALSSGHQRRQPWTGGGEGRDNAFHERGAVPAHLPTHDMDRAVHGGGALFVAHLLLRHQYPGAGGSEGEDVRPQPPSVPAVLSGEQGRQPHEPLHQRPRHHPGVLRRRPPDVL